MTNTPKKTTTRRKPAPSADKAPPVYFLSLEVERVLCFKDKQVLDLSDSNGNPTQWTVILGNNGVGKTTLLRCLAGMSMEEKPSSLSNSENRVVIIPLLFNAFDNSAWIKSLKKESARIDTQVTRNFLLKSLKKVRVTKCLLQN